MINALVKVCFLYFFEVMGVTKSDTDSMTILFKLLEKKSSQQDSKDLTKADEKKLDINFDNMIFCSVKKQAQNHLRIFKRFIKLLVNNCVDALPDSEGFLEQLTLQVCDFSKCKLKLLRVTFGHISCLLFKGIIAHKTTLVDLKQQFTLLKLSDQISTVQRALQEVTKVT